jgi:hypothetical protein
MFWEINCPCGADRLSRSQRRFTERFSGLYWLRPRGRQRPVLALPRDDGLRRFSLQLHLVQHLLKIPRGYHPNDLKTLVANYARSFPDGPTVQAARALRSAEPCMRYPR